MTPLRQRMINDMTVRGLAENTKKSYLNSVTGLARHYRRSPDQISAQEVQDYLIHLHEQRGLSWKSCNCVRHGVRFLYRITLGVPDPHFYLPGAKTPSTLPEILNHDELVRLFTVTTNPKHRSVLMTAYAAGLRASEIGRVRLSDIDSKRMLLRVDQGKGNKDRYVPLSPPNDVLGPTTQRRPAPHLLTNDEIRTLMAAALSLPPPGSITPHTWHCIIGLMATTGLRRCEVCALRLTDITPDGLVVRETKFQKSRLVPLHRSTVDALGRYLAIRRRCGGASEHLFVLSTGRSINPDIVTGMFVKLARQVGLRGGPGDGSVTLW